MPSSTVSTMNAVSTDCATKPWPTVRLGEVLTPTERGEAPMPGTTYRQIGVKLWGEGAYEREPMDGGATKYSQLFRAEAGDVIVNKIWARNGSVAVVSDALAGCYGSGEFPMFAPKRNQLESCWIHWLTKTRSFWAQCDEKSQGTSGKNRIKPERFLNVEIPLPPLAEQRRVVARIEELSAQIHEARTFREEIDRDLNAMLAAAHRQIAKDAPRKPLSEVAPLNRRPVTVELEKSYPAIAVRSFGRGTFHKPSLVGSEVTWEKPFLVKAGDILVSNIKAWEGALAVAKPEDDGRVGSHRYLTCVPTQGVATARFVCFHLLSPEGLHEIGEASPGSADRNRTLGAKAFLQIPIPVPKYSNQVWFDSICAEVDALKRLQAETAAELDALLPALLDRAFKGEL